MNLKKRNELIGKLLKAAFEEFENNYEYDSDKKEEIEYLEHEYDNVSEAIKCNNWIFIAGDIYSCIVSLFHLSAFAKLVPQDVYILCNTILDNKGADYQDNGDSFANFKATADKAGVTQYQVLFIHMDKHVEAILKAFRTDNFEFKGESLKEKFADAINYLGILYAMIENEGTVKDGN